MPRGKIVLKNPIRGIGDKTCWTKPVSGNLLLAMGIVKGKDHRTGSKDLAETLAQDACNNACSTAGGNSTGTKYAAGYK